LQSRKLKKTLLSLILISSTEDSYSLEERLSEYVQKGTGDENVNKSQDDEKIREVVGNAERNPGDEERNRDDKTREKGSIEKIKKDSDFVERNRDDKTREKGSIEKIKQDSDFVDPKFSVVEVCDFLEKKEMKFDWVLHEAIDGMAYQTLDIILLHEKWKVAHMVCV